MRRALAPLSLALLLLLPAAAPAASVDLPLRAKLTSCATGPEAADRRAAFTASMPPRAGAEVLELRFSLQRLGFGGWVAVDAPSFDRTERSDPGAPGFVFTKQVDGLSTPARWRASVRFTWRDARGRVVARATRRTSSCGQPDRRPDLRVRAVVLEGARDGVATWALRVVNEGRGPLEVPAEVALRVGGRPAVRTVLPRIERGETVEVRLAAPACAPGEALRAVADPAGDVRERDERDNVLELPCPG